MFVSKVTGVSTVIANMKKAKGDLSKQIEQGLKRAGLFLQRESMLQVPVDTGNLKATAYTRAEGVGFFTVVHVGYTAAYAVYVHEDTDALHGKAFNERYADRIANAKAARESGKHKRTTWHSRGENQKAKFLEDPMKENAFKLLRIIWGTKGGAASTEMRKEIMNMKKGKI